MIIQEEYDSNMMKPGLLCLQTLAIRKHRLQGVYIFCMCICLSACKAFTVTLY